LKSFPKKKKYTHNYAFHRVNLIEIFPGATPEAVDFLERMLKFNPQRRITVS
jgi:serine/threonine protein kinase